MKDVWIESLQLYKYFYNTYKLLQEIRNAHKI
jgi:hypothetical protein